MLARYGSLAVVLILVVAASWLAGGFDAGEWYYHDLGKPAWTPAPWMIAVAWALVYVFTALAAWLVWLSGHFSRLGALAWWAMLLVLNVAWSGLFFGLHRIGLGLAGTGHHAGRRYPVPARLPAAVAAGRLPDDALPRLDCISLGPERRDVDHQRRLFQPIPANVGAAFSRPIEHRHHQGA